MFAEPTKRRPKRVGGAPFTAAPGARRAHSKLPLSARAPKSKAADLLLLDVPGSARGHSSAPATDAERGDGSITPLTRRAEEYYSRIMGRAASQEADTRQDWTVVQELDTLDNINRDERSRRKEREKNVKNQAELQEQMERRNRVANQCREVWKEWGAQVEEDAVLYHKETEKKKTAIKERQQADYKDLKRNLEEARERQGKQREQDKKLEEEWLLKAEKAKKDQEESDEKKRVASKHAMMEMRGQMEVAQKRRQETKEKELQQDIKDQRQFTELLDKQEKARHGYFQALRAKQQTLLAKYEAGVGNDLAKMEALETERAEKQAEERYEKQQQAMEKERLWRQNLRDSGVVAVQQQLSIQAAQRQREHEDHQRFLSEKQREGEIAQANESEKVQRRKQARLENAEFLRMQIEEKDSKVSAKKVHRAQMNDVERSLNRDRLNRACDAGRSDGLPMLLRKKRAEYLLQQQRDDVGLPG